MKIYPVLLAGGVGTRLWPISTRENPKQFSKLFGQLSLFQITVKRFYSNPLFHDPLIVTNQKYSGMAREQLAEIGIEIGKYNILEEPAVRDTGPAIALATEYLLRKDPEAILLLVPADHYIPRPERFVRIVESGTHYLPNIVLFGIEPQSPETGYGYIHIGSTLENDHARDSTKPTRSTKSTSSTNSTDEPPQTCHRVIAFQEKPDTQTAQKYVEAGDYYWNSGIYLFRGKTLMTAFQEYEPEIAQKIAQIWESGNMELFSNIKSISIDYAITERAKNVVMMRCPIQWSDVGSWKGLWQIMEKDENNNFHQGDIISLESKNNLVHGQKRIITIGLNNIAVVETDENILIINKDFCQEVKKIAKMRYPENV